MGKNLRPQRRRFAPAPLLITRLAMLFIACQALEVTHRALFADFSQQSQATQSGLSLSLHAARNVVQAGSAVKVAFAATNLTDHDVQYSCWILIPCGLKVRDGNGNEPPDTKLHRRFWVEHSPNVAVEEILTGTLGLGVLRPGEVKKYSIDVDGWYDFIQPGTYTIQVVQTSENGETWLKSNAITLKVVPAATAQSTPSTVERAASRPAFSLSIRMDSNPGSPVGLTIRTTNISDHRITLRTEKASKEQAGSIYKVDVRDSTGASPLDSEFGRLTKNRDDSPPPLLSAIAPRGGGVSLSLKPGEDWADCIMLYTVFTLNKPDRYTIQVRRWDDETRTWVKSNIVAVTLDQYGRVQSPPSSAGSR